MLFRLEKLSYRYSDGTLALDAVSLSFDRGERIALLGTNGSGKTTLLNHLNGILKPTSGTIYFEDQPLEYSSKALLSLRKRVGFVFQDPNDQLFASTVKQDVAFGPLNLGYAADETKKLVDQALQTVGMTEFSEKPPHFLSLGQKKRVALAGVLAMQPEVIVMDEPTANLDPRATSEILHLLLKLNKDAGITLVLATHDVDMVPLFANRLYILNKGKIVSEGVPKEIFSNADLIRNVNLRSPRIAHLFEVLKKENNLPIPDQLPLTISEARKAILELLDEKPATKLKNAEAKNIHKW
ncbi:MAG: ATP-binding cassette domain-containing protein [Candidatus Bathyarchaeota archaeon]|nr:ATP-binding cassette domain-containing protein [Candidatus Bathyarchaeota archaeon]